MVNHTHNSKFTISQEAKKSDESTTKDCPDCITRLYHIPTSTFITSENRKVFIADGTMYDEFADLCQAAAQEIMAEKCKLTWVTICDGKNGSVNTRQMMENITPADTSNNSDEFPVNRSENSLEPIRALVTKQTHNNPNRKPHDTLLISTGKGKVRAGIFSRQHLLTTGLEPATCLPLLVEAQNRDMHCVVIDPNARTDREGMATFEASVRSLFDCHCELKEDEIEDGALGGDMDPSVPVDGSIFVLAHSASGGQLVRYLLNRQSAQFLSRIRSISFTDSTHSIQWVRNHPHLASLIQSSKSLYIKTFNPMRDEGNGEDSGGVECPKDQFWTHRFGEIRTIYSGTTEHSLSNWSARDSIWKHFDKNRDNAGTTSEDPN
mmetsp:Transcript_22183/g.45207  ORF Transcript_22183/g.45207 Transcript_22183/m.45207 type:complete len:378 (-) Transcript_22183:85-1218(-)